MGMKPVRRPKPVAPDQSVSVSRLAWQPPGPMPPRASKTGRLEIPILMCALSVVVVAAALVATLVGADEQHGCSADCDGTVLEP